MKGLVSIVIPVYNVENYLDRCVESIVSQTYKDLEIILVDDGSKDSSGKLCDKWKEKDNRIKVIHKENGGLSSARNAGIDIFKGEYIFFVDSDDYVDENTIQYLMDKMENYKSDIVICNRYHFFDNGKKYLKYGIIDNDLVMDSKQAIYEMNSFIHYDMSAWGKLYKRDLFKEIRFPLGKISEDFYIMYLVFDKAKKIVYNSTPLYYYYQRSGSITKTTKVNYDFVKAAQEQMLYVEKKYPELKACVHVAYASANITAYNGVLKNGGKMNKSETKKLQKEVSDNYKYVSQIDNFPFSKKIQLFLFSKCRVIYDFVFKLYRLVKKV